jgi:hypothetical protein
VSRLAIGMPPDQGGPSAGAHSAGEVALEYGVHMHLHMRKNHNPALIGDMTPLVPDHRISTGLPGITTYPTREGVQ